MSRVGFSAGQGSYVYGYDRDEGFDLIAGIA